MIFAIVHELGHLIAGLILRFKPEEIRLTPVGLQIRFKADYQKENFKNNKEIEIKRAIEENERKIRKNIRPKSIKRTDAYGH